MAHKMEASLAKNQDSLPVFDAVKDFGAINTGLQVTTKQLQNAIDACAKRGTGRVYFPPGDYLTGTLILKSGVHLELAAQAKILGSTNEQDYLVITPHYKNNTDRQVNKSLFYAEKVSDISLTGSGVIDFQGDSPVYQYSHDNDPRRPFGIRFVTCTNVYVRGLKLLNSAQWLEHYLDCENVMLEDLNVFNHARQNNDGMDIDGCRNVYVRNCRVDSDDDGICLKSNGPGSCENVLIEHCAVSSHCNVLKLGTESTGGFKHICIKNISVVPSVAGKLVYGSRRGNAGIGLMIADGGTLDDVTISNVTIRGPRAPFYIRLGNRSRKYMDGVPEPPVGIVRNITLSDITISDVQSKCSWICGLPDHPVENVTLRNIRIVAPGFAGKVPVLSTDEKAATYPGENLFFSQPASCIFIRHARNITLDHLTFATTTPETRPPLLAVDVNGLVIRDAHALLPGERPVFLRGMGVKGLDFTVPKDWNGVGQELAP